MMDRRVSMLIPVYASVERSVRFPLVDVVNDITFAFWSINQSFLTGETTSGTCAHV